MTGWYTATNGTGQKVLDAEGKIVTNDDGTNVSIPGFITDGMLNLEGDQTLYARWTRKVNVFAKTDFPTDGGTVLIGSEDADGLHLLTATSSKGNYSLGFQNISAARNGCFYSDAERLNSAERYISGSPGANGNCSIVVSGTNAQYLARDGDVSWDGITWTPVVKKNIQASNSWIVMVDGNNRVNSVYFTYEFKAGPVYITETFYLSVTDSGAKISSNESAISFYTIQNVEEESYD